MKVLREEIVIPVHVHTHDTSGINSASVLKAADAGADVADAAVGAMSGGTSQPNLNSILEASATLEKKLADSVRRDGLLSYLLYTDVFIKYDKFRRTYADVSVLPTPIFYYGMGSGEEVTIEIEPGKTLILKFLTASDPHPDETRTLFFELNGQPRRRPG
ncbi:MAG: hypothetical protein WBR10_20835 [Candidatus Acidiferrum sp.]